MLWIDANFVTSSDLQSVDGEILDVVDAEQLTLTGQNGLIWRTQEDCGRDLLARMVTFSGFLAGDSLSANHLQAVFNIGTPAVQRTRILLDNIIVTGQNVYTWSELKGWVVYRTLQSVYRAAANRTTQDRYKIKRDDYGHEAKWVRWPNFKQLGVPVVYKPMATPGAVLGHNSGSFVVSAAAGGGTLTGNYDVALTYIDTTVTTSPSNSESNPSAISTVTLAPGEVISADITKLNPPNGLGNPLDIARSIITPLNATGWNIYAGLSGGTLTLQNSSPIPIGTKTHALPGDPISTGVAAGLGQYVNQYLTLSETIGRG